MPRRTEQPSDLREFAAELRDVHGMPELSPLLIEHSRRLGRISTLNLMTIRPGASGPESGVQWSERHSPEWLFKAAVEVLPATERDVPARPIFGSGRARVVDINRTFEPLGLLGTETYNENWRPYHFERQLLAFIGTRAEPLGFLCFARTAWEPAFGDKELRLLDAFRGLIRPVLRRILHPEPPAPALDERLALLAAGVPTEAVMFDESGRIVWLSGEALVRMRPVSGWYGPYRWIADVPGWLESWRAAAVRAIRGGAVAGSRSSVGPDPAINMPEKVTVTVFTPQRGSPGLALVAAVPSASPVPADGPVGAARRPLELTPRQWEVARLAAQGYAVLNISARTGLAVETVRTHLKGAYRRLGVFNRAELACRLLLDGRISERSGGPTGSSS